MVKFANYSILPIGHSSALNISKVINVCSDNVSKPLFNVAMKHYNFNVTSAILTCV